MQDKSAIAAEAATDGAGLHRFSRAGAWFWAGHYHSRRVASALRRLQEWHRRHGRLGRSCTAGAQSRVDRLLPRERICHSSAFDEREAGALILRISRATHTPFRILFRAPFGIFDAANCLFAVLAAAGKSLAFLRDCLLLRILFLSAVLVTPIITSLPTLIQPYKIVFTNVF